MKHQLPSLDAPIVKKRDVNEEEKALWQYTINEEFPSQAAVNEVPETVKKSLPVKKVVVKKPVKSPLQIDNSKSRIITQATFDLHGYTLKTAYPALTGFILNAVSAKHRYVLVITGKGKQEGNATLRAMLPYWLQETGLKHYVTNFSYAKEKHGGTGAFYVKVKHKKD